MPNKIEHETPAGFRRRTEGSRVMYAPKTSARAAHARFYLQVKNYPLLFSDPLVEVRRHLEHGHRFFFKTDLESAFDQVTAKHLLGILSVRGINPAWLTPKEHFFHEYGRGGLIQGAPASPYLFETYCRYGGLDHDLREYCDKLGFYYSRYVDDVLISSKRPLGRRVGPSVRKIVSTYGFVLSDRKTKRVDVHTEPLLVLGYLIRGSRIDPAPETLQLLFDPETSEATRSGLFKWRRHVRERGGSRRAVHR